jgi:opacity protein-like surface antigen
MKRIFLAHAALFCLLGELQLTSNATTPVDHLTNLKNGNTWFVGIGSGLSQSHFSDSTTTVSNGSGATPPSQNDFLTIKKPNIAGIAQFTVGYRWQREKKFIPYYQIYFQYRHYLTTDVDGTVEQYSLPTFLNYNYSTSFDADLYTVNGKFDLVQFKNMMPYLAVGAGVIVTNLYRYSETAFPGVTQRTNPNYDDGRNQNLAVTLGAGIDITLTKNVWATVGYEHVFQGTAKTKQGSGSWSSTSLNLGHVHSDTVFLNFSAKFPDTFKN